MKENKFFAETFRMEISLIFYIFMVTMKIQKMDIIRNILFSLKSQ